MPASAEAEEDKRRKVRGSACAPCLVISRSARLADTSWHARTTPADPVIPPPQAAIIKIRGWVESHVPAEHLKSRACVIDIQEVWALVHNRATNSFWFRGSTIPKAF